MPDLPINALMPDTEDKVKTWQAWFKLLGGGGLALLISVIGMVIAYNLFSTLMDERAEDRIANRQEDKEFREQMLDATVAHTTATVQQTAVQEKTNEGLEEVKDALVGMGERIESLADNEAETAKRLDRMLEKAWNAARPTPQPQPTPPTEQ